MKKLISRTLCLILLLILIIPIVTSCGNSKIFSLGKYSITEKEYIYLTGMYKKQALVSESPNEKLTDEDFSREITNGVTLGEYINYKYRASFEQSILTLLYSQLMFDELGLSLSDDEKNSIEATAEAVSLYYGAESLNAHGFDKKTLASVYEKQFKENKVRQHILGANNERVTDEDIESYYLENYLRYKIIVINTLFRKHTDSSGDETLIFLSDAEKERQEQLVVELKELLVNQNKNYKYEILKDDLNLSYDELWEKYSYDKTYPDGGYGPSKPSQEELNSNKLLFAAYNCKVGEVKTTIAEQPFKEGATVEGENGTTTIKPGDYFEYGTVFVKRLPLDAGAYKKTENESFFPAGKLEASAANLIYFQTLMEHEASSALEIKIADKGAKITFDTVKANEIDYYYLYGKDGKKA